MEELSKGYDSRISDLNAKIKISDEELKPILQKMKGASGASHNMLKQKATNLLRKKKLLEAQLNRNFGNQMLIDNVKFQKDMIEDQKNMGTVLKEQMKVQQKMMDEVDYDEMMDNYEEMNDNIYEINAMNDMINNYNNNMLGNEDIDEEFENLKNEFNLENLANEYENKDKAKPKNKNDINYEDLGL